MNQLGHGPKFLNPVVNHNCTIESEPDAFVKWLTDKADDEYAGSARGICSCPLAQYLKSQGARMPYVDKFAYHCNGKQDTAKHTPDWAALFMKIFDDTFKRGRRTVKDVILVLRQLDINV